MTDGTYNAEDAPRPEGSGQRACGTDRRRAVIYTRTAAPVTEASRAHHVEQEEACRRLAERLGLEVIAVASDTGAPGSLQAGNSGWMEVEGLIRSMEVDFVLASSLDRLTRSWTDLAVLYRLSIEFNVEILSASRNTTNDGRTPGRRLPRKTPPVEHRRPRRGGAPGHPGTTEGDR